VILIPQHLLQVLERKGPLFYNPAPEISHNADRLKPSRARAETIRARLGDWIRKLGVDDPEGQSTHAWAHLMIADRAGIAEKMAPAMQGQLDVDVAGQFNFDTPLHYTATITSKGRMASALISDVKTELEGERMATVSSDGAMVRAT
jgi:hypothetical protein